MLITDIFIAERLREDLGDIQSLMDSLETHGIIHPIVIDQNNRLVAGGRRTHAAVSLGWTEALPANLCEVRNESGELTGHRIGVLPFNYKHTLSLDQLREFELEENIRRKDMTWQEKTLAICDIHSLKQMNSALAGKQWGVRETGELLNVHYASVQHATVVGRALRAKDPDILAASTFMEAYKLVFKKREDEAKKLLVTSTSGVAMITTERVEDAESLEAAESSVENQQDQPGEQVAPTKIAVVDLSKFIFKGNCIDVMNSQPEGWVDHIITDPPYAIDMGMLDQGNTGMKNIGDVAPEHQVEDNKQLLKIFLRAAYRSLKDKGFCALWYDLDMHAKLMSWAGDVGFTVCRWPVIWCKPQGMNQAAGFNFTKATEVCMILRKGNATLVEHQPLNWRMVEKSEEDKLRFAQHPFAKPLALWGWLITALTLPSATILDPFAGSGSCPIACMKNNRRWKAIEVSPLHQPDLTRAVKEELGTLFKGNVKFINE